MKINQLTYHDVENIQNKWDTQSMQINDDKLTCVERSQYNTHTKYKSLINKYYVANNTTHRYNYYKHKNNCKLITCHKQGTRHARHKYTKRDKIKNVKRRKRKKLRK